MNTYKPGPCGAVTPGEEFLLEKGFDWKKMLLDLRLKDSMLMSFFIGSGSIKWSCSNFSDSLGGLKDGSKEELMVKFLNEASVSLDVRCCRSFNVVGSKIFMMVPNKVQVLDNIEPSWVDIPSSIKACVNPCALFVDGKTFVLGAEDGVNEYTPGEIFAEVLTGEKVRKWEVVPFLLPKTLNWFHCFVLPYENGKKIIVGSRREKCLYLYDVCSYQVDVLDVGCLPIQCFGYLPPVVLGNKIVWFFNAQIIAFDMVTKAVWKGVIDSLDRSFFIEHCGPYGNPRLIHLGSDILGLVCFRARSPHDDASTVHCCVFKLTECSGQESLRGHVQFFHKFYTCRTGGLLDVLLL